MREAIVLAGGFGTRLRQVVADVPKPMASIAGKPFLEILLQQLASKGFKRVILSLGYMAEKITAHFNSQFAGMELVMVTENTPLGTGGAVRLAMAYCQHDHVFIFNGDTYLDLEVEQLEQQWQQSRRPIIVGRYVPDTTRYGRLQVTNQLVVEFTEKNVSGPGLINAGCYVFNAGQLDDFPLYQAFALETEYLSKLVQTMPVDIFVTAGRFIDIGDPVDYARANTYTYN